MDKELVIVHESGWACTNTAKQDYRVIPKDGGFRRYNTLVGQKVYNVVGELKNGDKVSAMIKDKGVKAFEGTINISNGFAVVQIEKETQTNLIINKIEKNGWT